MSADSYLIANSTIYIFSISSIKNSISEWAI
jgi:hypothetical protein